MSRFETAVDSYEMAIAIQDDFASRWYNRGNALANMGRTEEAIKSYRKVIALEGGDAATWYNIGLAFEEMEEYAQAFEYFGKVVQEDKEHPEAWYGMACCLDALGQYDDALKLFDRVLALKPDVAEFWHAKADCLYNAGNTTEALQTYKQVVADHPDNRDAWLDLAEICLETGQAEAALNACTEALSQHPDADGYLLRARVLFVLERMEEGLDSLSTALRMDPNMREEFRRSCPDMCATYNSDTCQDSAMGLRRGYSLRKSLTHAAQGLLMGAADIVPGVSGGYCCVHRRYLPPTDCRHWPWLFDADRAGSRPIRRHAPARGPP